MLFKNLSPFLKCKKDDVYPLILDKDQLVEKIPEYESSVRGITDPFAAVVCPICKGGTSMFGVTQRRAADYALQEWNWQQRI